MTRAIRTVVDGIAFDSATEAEDYRRFVLLLRAGQLKAVALQPQFELVPASEGRRPVLYTADFLLVHTDGRLEIVDSGAIATRDWEVRWKAIQEACEGSGIVFRSPKKRAKKRRKASSSAARAAKEPEKMPERMDVEEARRRGILPPGRK